MGTVKNVPSNCLFVTSERNPLICSEMNTTPVQSPLVTLNLKYFPNVVVCIISTNSDAFNGILGFPVFLGRYIVNSH